MRDPWLDENNELSGVSNRLTLAIGEFVIAYGLLENAIFLAARMFVVSLPASTASAFFDNAKPLRPLLDEVSRALAGNPYLDHGPQLATEWAAIKKTLKPILDERNRLVHHAIAQDVDSGTYATVSLQRYEATLQSLAAPPQVSAESVRDFTQSCRTLMRPLRAITHGIVATQQHAGLIAPQGDDAD